jgi:hypothetical protein
MAREDSNARKGATIVLMCVILVVGLTAIEVATNPAPRKITTVTTTPGAAATAYTTYPNVTVVLTNAQSAAAQPGFQQMLETYSSPIFQNVSEDGGNVRFYIGKTELYSWRESPTEWWVRLPGGIPAGSEISVNMTFLPAYEEYDGYYAGEAPQLSAAYGQYDNGANVFGFYANFTGALPSGWSQVETAGTYSIHDGLTLMPKGSWDSIGSSAGYDPEDTVFETYQEATNGTNMGGGFGVMGSKDSPTYGVGYGLGGAGPVCDLLYYDRGTLMSNELARCDGTSLTVYGVWITQNRSYDTFDIEGSLDNGPAHLWSGWASSSGDFAPTQSMRIGTGALSGTSFTQWIRTRDLPPNGVMPQATFIAN